MEAKYKQMMEEFTKSKGALPEPVRLTAQQLRARFPGLDTKNNFNFAVVGESGVGKSSLINALRGLKALDAGNSFFAICLSATSSVQAATQLQSCCCKMLE